MMAIRLRKDATGKWVALCAADWEPRPNDVYLTDGMHTALTEKFTRDFEKEGIIRLQGFRAYHGTDKATAQIILKEGIKSGCFWTQYRETALRMGGKHIFAAVFNHQKITNWNPDSGDWQFINSEPIPIADLKYEPPVFIYNKGRDDE